MAPEPYIRYTDPDDVGNRPIPPGVAFWTTPAIRLVNAANPAQDPAVAIADVDQVIHVEVGNKGTTQANATVQTWVRNFGPSGGYLATAGGTTGTAHPIVVPPGATGATSAHVDVPWHPQGPELGGAAEIHVCVQANVFVNPADQLGGPATPPAIDVPNVIRHAQRNMTLRATAAAGGGMKMPMGAGHAGSREQREFTLEAVEVHGKLSAAEVAHVAHSRWIDPKGRKGLVVAGTGGALRVRPAGEGERAKEIVMRLDRHVGPKLGVAFAPGDEQQVLTLVVELGGGRDGVLHRFDVVQRAGREIVGAARVLALGLPDELLGQKAS